MRKENFRGITLIALVVTIVVLLILAATSISMLTGENGIITQANKASLENKGANIQEERDLWIQEREIAKKTGQTAKSMEEILDELKEKGTLTDEEVEGILNDANNEIKVGDRVISFKVMDYDIVEPGNVGDWIYRVEDDGTATIIGYKGSDTKVVIPNYIDGMQVKKIESSQSGWKTLWDSSICSGTSNEPILGYAPRQNTITDVIISEGIEEIGDFTFVASIALKNISIPSTVKVIGSSAFAGCSTITNIEIPLSVTKIDSYTFAKCKSLTEITIPSSVVEVGHYMFTAIPKITVNVPFKINEKPSTWDDEWNEQYSSMGSPYIGEIIVNYKQ